MEQGTRIGLGPIDRLVLLGAWFVSCAAVYGLGFYTGNHTQDRLAGEEERVVRLPVTVAPPPVGQRPKSSDDLSFWNALESSGPRIKPGENLPVRPPPVETTADVSDAPPKAPAGGQATSSSRSAKAGQQAGPKTTPKTTPKTSPKATATAAAGKRPPTKAAAASGKVASKAPQATAAPAKASAPAATAKRPATPAVAKPAPRAQSTATASAPRAAAPPRKAPATPTREARAAAD